MSLPAQPARSLNVTISVNTNGFQEAMARIAEAGMAGAESAAELQSVVWANMQREIRDRIRIVTPPLTGHLRSVIVPLNPMCPDSMPFDLHPDDCWRCDASPAMSDLGTCDDCLTDLRSNAC